MADWRFLAAFVLLTATLTGCIGSGTEPQEVGPADIGSAKGVTPDATTEAADTVLPAPTWEVGQWWSYESPQIGAYTYVVTEDAGQDWFIETTNEDVAFFHARQELSMMGEIRKDDLAGSQGSDRVQFFHFPLEAGKSWTTPWDGEQHTITVLDVVEGVANLEARVDGALATTYTYDASTGWFGEIQFYDANETIVFEAGPTDAGTSFTGEVARWTFHADVGGGGTLQPVALPINVEFDVPEEATDIWVSLEAHCPSGAFLFGFGPEDEGPGGENGWGVIEPCPYMTSFETVAVEDPVPGRWDGGVIAGSPAAQGEFLFVIVVRTLERVPVTA